MALMTLMVNPRLEIPTTTQPANFLSLRLGDLE